MPAALLDPATLLARRRAAQAERARLSEDRWGRFQAANRARYAFREARRLSPTLAKLVARAKTPGRILLLRLSGLWEADLATSLGSMAGPTVSLADYVTAGPDAAFQPAALFDQSWYLQRAPALVGSRWPLLAHYLVVGDSHNLSPHPLFDGPAYRSRHGAEMSARRLTALEHFLFVGAATGANPHPLFDVRHYVGQSDEVASTGENPLIHYLRTGWREGLEPHPLFAGAWYLERHPQAASAETAPLLHYVTAGAAEGLDPHPLFDTAHYRRQRHNVLRGDPLSDYLASGARANQALSPSPQFQPARYLDQPGVRPLALPNPLLHYLGVGTFEGLWPAADFDEVAYFLAHPAIVETPMSGLEHWVRHRTVRPPRGAPASGGLSAETLFRDLRRAADPDPEAYGVEDYQALRRLRSPSPAAPPVRVIAFRRSQAPVWPAIVGALPDFHGHLQPRLPTDGFRDPLDPAALKRDVALAGRYGLAGFCHEVATAAAAKTVAAAGFPFCLAWTGGAPAKAVLEALAHPDAIRIDGKPVVALAPDTDLAAWRKAGDAFLIQRGGPPASGFDARLPDLLTARAPEGPPGPVINPDFRGLVHDGLALVRERMAEPVPADAFPLVVAGHDSTPQSQDAPVIWHGVRPGALQAWLEAASDAVRDRPADRRLVFIHAWNDWETGAALGPDVRFGHGWLEAMANAADADLLTPAPAP